MNPILSTPLLQMALKANIERGRDMDTEVVFCHTKKRKFKLG